MNWTIAKGCILTLSFTYGAYTDIKSREIPNVVPITIFLSGLIEFSPLRACIGFVIIGFVFLLAAMFGNMGGGDIRLMTACGFALGLWGGILQTIIGLSLAALYALGLRVTKKKKDIRHLAIPLAPFLGVGGILAYILK